MSDISYGGPKGDFVPLVGENLAGGFIAPIAAVSGYANVAQLTDNLVSLVDLITSLIGDLETALQSLSLPVTTDASDDKLRAAHQQEWPANLGTPKDFISYRYYKSLEQRTTAAATYIRGRYEQAARDVNGSNAIDYLPLAKIILGEAQLIQEFLSRNISVLDDSAETRAVEHLQDWVQNALDHTGFLRSYFEQDPSSRLLPSSETDSLDAAGASSAQALFKVNLNKLNTDLTQQIEFLTRNFSTYAGTFYNNFLTPALNFRQKVTSNLTPIYGGRLGVEMSASHLAVDKHMSTILADQLRRNQLFTDQINQIEDNTQLRDNYRTYIQQLGILGTALSVGTAGSMITATDAPAEATQFDNTIPVTGATPNFSAPHGLLAGLDDPVAHEQYFLKGGDTLTGNLLLDAGVTIDGIVPHAHSHSGVDGTSQIHGADILPGSINPNTIDPNAIPTVPHGLNIFNQTVVLIPPGVPASNTILSWEGDPGLTFEVQYFTTEIGPSASVTNVIATAGDASATIIWTPPSGVNLIMNFVITPYIGAVPQVTTTINGPWYTSTAFVAGLINGTDYTFTVISGTSAESVHSNVVRPVGLPGAPTLVHALPGRYGTAKLTWALPFDGGEPITEYIVTPYIGDIPQAPTIVSP